MPADPSGRYGHIQIIGAERRLLVDGSPVALGSRAFDLLAALVVRRDRLVPKAELIDAVWPGLVVEDNNLQVQVSALRKALGATAIATVAGRGYRFTVEATAAPRQAPTVPPPPSQSTPARRATDRATPPARLLVADDNKVNRLLLCRTLALMGHAVDSAADGIEALAMLRGKRHDLLLLDLQMPGLDGFGLLEQRAADGDLGDVPVIVTSGVEGVAAMARCIELGADDFLHKPVNPVLLKARVDSSLERKRLRDRQRALLAQLSRMVPRGMGGAGGLDAQRGDGAAPAPAESRHLQATVLAVRIADIGALSSQDQQPAGDVLDLLGAWATLMLDAVAANGGRTCRNAGDALVAVFDNDDDDGSGARAAVAAAREMLASSAQLDAERPAGNGVLAIGIASGSVLCGSTGAPVLPGQAGQGAEAAACIGPTVQRALAMQEQAATHGTPTVLLDRATQAGLDGDAATATMADDVLALRLG